MTTSMVEVTTATHPSWCVWCRTAVVWGETICKLNLQDDAYGYVHGQCVGAVTRAVLAHRRELERLRDNPRRWRQ